MGLCKVVQGILVLPGFGLICWEGRRIEGGPTRGARPEFCRRAQANPDNFFERPPVGPDGKVDYGKIIERTLPWCVTLLVRKLAFSNNSEGTIHLWDSG